MKAMKKTGGLITTSKFIQTILYITLRYGLAISYGVAKIFRIFRLYYYYKISKSVVDPLIKFSSAPNWSTVVMYCEFMAG